jgi:hypothetical protein
MRAAYLFRYNRKRFLSLEDFSLDIQAQSVYRLE